MGMPSFPMGSPVAPIAYHNATLRAIYAPSRSTPPYTTYPTSGTAVRGNGGTPPKVKGKGKEGTATTATVRPTLANTQRTAMMQAKNAQHVALQNMQVAHPRNHIDELVCQNYQNGGRNSFHNHTT